MLYCTYIIENTKLTRYHVFMQSLIVAAMKLIMIYIVKVMAVEDAMGVTCKIQ